ncbi:MAG: hypothetical protein JWR75_1619 [Devosia sp.]|nr:hypothetical protein [Devosia sp.]
MILQALLRPFLSTSLLLAGLAAPALGDDLRQTPVAVLELFTSQGCSSCPPADALLETLAQRSDIVALAYHVNYWDYVGWPDTFGAEANSDYQRRYAAMRKSSRIYTPQLMVNGTADVVGSREAEVYAAIDAATLPLPIAISIADDMLVVDIAAQAKLEDAVIWLVTYIDEADVAIERGENAGKTIRYMHVVTDRMLAGMWEADTGAHLKLPLSKVLSAPTDGVAILVQGDRDGLPGEILGAASYQR